MVGLVRFKILLLTTIFFASIKHASANILWPEINGQVARLQKETSNVLVDAFDQPIQATRQSTMYEKVPINLRSIVHTFKLY